MLGSGRRYLQQYASFRICFGFAQEGSARTGVIHVLEEPLHRGLRVRVARREQRLLCAHGREAHPLELRHRLGVELWQGRRSYMGFSLELGGTWENTYLLCPLAILSHQVGGRDPGTRRAGERHLRVG